VFDDLPYRAHFGMRASFDCGIKRTLQVMPCVDQRFTSQRSISSTRSMHSLMRATIRRCSSMLRERYLVFPKVLHRDPWQIGTARVRVCKLSESG
jgi:hypothetical protein